MFSPGPNPHGDPPIFLAGVGPRMTEVAGEVADGFFVHPFHTPDSLAKLTQRGLAQLLFQLGLAGEQNLENFLLRGLEVRLLHEALHGVDRHLTGRQLFAELDVAEAGIGPRRDDPHGGERTARGGDPRRGGQGLAEAHRVPDRPVSVHADHLRVAAAVHDRGAGPPDPDRVRRPTHASRAQLGVDEELVDRVGVEAPGLRPVRGDVARLGQLPPGGRRVLGEPGPHGAPARVVVARQLEVHRGTVPRVLTARSRQ